jgi:mRNA interferase MazF
MTIRRGQIYWLDFGQPRGSGPAFERPGLVIQDNFFNQTNIHTVIVAIITTNLRLAEMDGNVLLMPRRNGVSFLSVVNITQLYTVDKAELIEPIGTVTKSEMDKIDRGLRLVLSLEINEK